MNQVTQAVRDPKEEECQISGMISSLCKKEIITGANPGSWFLLSLQFWEPWPTGWLDDSSNIFPSKDENLFSTPSQIYFLQKMTSYFSPLVKYMYFFQKMKRDFPPHIKYISFKRLCSDVIAVKSEWSELSIAMIVDLCNTYLGKS